MHFYFIVTIVENAKTMEKAFGTSFKLIALFFLVFIFGDVDTEGDVLMVPFLFTLAERNCFLHKENCIIRIDWDISI